MQKRTTTIILAATAAFALVAAVACSPVALEAKRLADQCNAIYGFSTEKSAACMNTGFERIAMADASPQNKGL
ncbi:MAG: hypothetical protein OSB60_09305 [Myxococcota bacterium]|nr:hypothetical protein [Myxococcota bacterium]